MRISSDPKAPLNRKNKQTKTLSIFFFFVRILPFKLNQIQDATYTFIISSLPHCAPNVPSQTQAEISLVLWQCRMWGYLDVTSLWGLCPYSWTNVSVGVSSSILYLLLALPDYPRGSLWQMPSLCITSLGCSVLAAEWTEWDIWSLKCRHVKEMVSWPPRAQHPLQRYLISAGKGP